MVDVDQLGVLLAVAAEQYVRQRPGRVQRREARDAQQQRLSVQGDVVLDGAVAQRAGNTVEKFSSERNLINCSLFLK